MKTICFLFLFAFLQGSNCQVGNAGAKVVLTKQGMDYAAGRTVEVMDQKIRGAQIDDVQGDANVKVGKVHYEIQNTRITEFTKPSAGVTVNPGQGLTLSLSGAGVSAEGNWRYRFKKAFIKFRDSGSFSASANGISISVSVSFQNENGVPKIAATGCQCSIDDVHFKLRGGASWLYNIFIKFFKKKIRSSFENIFCKEAQNAINDNGAKELASLNMVAQINELLSISYALAADPIFQDNYMESNHVGRFLGDDVVENAPPLQGSTDQMVSASISDVTFNSALRVLHNNGKLQYGEDITDNVVIGLISNILEESGIPYNGVGFGVTVGTSSAPTVSIQPGSLALNAVGEAKIDILGADGSRQNAITVKVTTNIHLQVAIQEDKLTGSVLDFKVGIASSNLSEAENEKLTNAINHLVELVKPSLNGALSQGLPLPNLQGIHFKDPVIHLNDRHITISTNAEYSG